MVTILCVFKEKIPELKFEIRSYIGGYNMLEIGFRLIYIVLWKIIKRKKYHFSWRLRGLFFFFFGLPLNCCTILSEPSSATTKNDTSITGSWLTERTRERQYDRSAEITKLRYFTCWEKWDKVYGELKPEVNQHQTLKEIFLGFLFCF